jgi:hypothetical protein
VLSTNYKEIALSYAELPTIDSLGQVAMTTESYQQRWAAGQLALRHASAALPTEYARFPVQAWRLGNVPLVFLGGEVVVDYVLQLKAAWGRELVVAAYANDVMAYIPSERVLKEGGYEGLTSMCVYGHPSRWASGIEHTILETISAQIKSVGIVPAE